MSMRLIPRDDRSQPQRQKGSVRTHSDYDTDEYDVEESRQQEQAALQRTQTMPESAGGNHYQRVPPNKPTISVSSALTELLVKAYKSCRSEYGAWTVSQSKSSRIF